MIAGTYLHRIFLCHSPRLVGVSVCDGLVILELDCFFSLY